MNRCEMCEEEMTQKEYNFSDICQDCRDGEPSPLDELGEEWENKFDKYYEKRNQKQLRVMGVQEKSNKRQRR
tara:strand:- start:2338 stop:2553 length:216 start_codon:yes stop_codon:yes gene_type:complete